jgi:hypothetical protein
VTPVTLKRNQQLVAISAMEVSQLIAELGLVNPVVVDRTLSRKRFFTWCSITLSTPNSFIRSKDPSLEQKFAHPPPCLPEPFHNPTVSISQCVSSSSLCCCSKLGLAIENGRQTKISSTGSCWAFSQREHEPAGILK